MNCKHFLKTDRLREMQRSDAIATLRMRRLRREASLRKARAYLCKIGESDFAAQIAARNPRWDLKIVNQKVIYSQTVSHA